jgi:hypothetical protein
MISSVNATTGRVNHTRYPILPAYHDPTTADLTNSAPSTSITRKFIHPLTPILVFNEFGPDHRGISKNRRNSAKVSVNAMWHNRSLGEVRSQIEFGNEGKYSLPLSVAIMNTLPLCILILNAFCNPVASGFFLDSKLRLMSARLDSKQIIGLKKKIIDTNETIRTVKLSLVETQAELKRLVNSGGSSDSINKLNVYEKELSDRINDLKSDLDHYRKSLEKLNSRVRIKPVDR